MEALNLTGVKTGMSTSKYTKVLRESDKHIEFNAPHHFLVVDAENENPICKVDFQKGPIKECGVNGVCNEDLLNMALERLQYFQKSEYSCRENAVAITKIEEALMWLRKRTDSRENRGVEGTHEV